MATSVSVRRKIGHWRLTKDGIITYKRKPASELVKMIQLGIRHSVARDGKLEREPLMHDFESVESGYFPAKGTAITPEHNLADFRFVTYAPLAFRYFRALYGIDNDDYIQSVCDEPLSEIANPGASGSLFFMSNDNCFIIKTVQKREATFLQKLLPVYYVNLSESRNTLLPKFFGLYNCLSGRKNIRLLVMNNLLPPYVNLKYDLKGSTYKRLASYRERQKAKPTLKDLDFLSSYPGRIKLDDEKLRALEETVERDTKILRSLAIIDYSLLIGIYTPDQSNDNAAAETETTSANRQHAEGMIAHTESGQKMYLFLGIIDILQSYRFVKRLEHYLKALVHDGDTISVHRPDFYAVRFTRFIFERVFEDTSGQSGFHRGGLRRSASAGDFELGGSNRSKKFLKPPIVNVIPPTIGASQGRRIASYVAYSVSHHNLADPLDLAWTQRRLTLKRQKATTMDDNYFDCATRPSMPISRERNLSPPSRRGSLHASLNLNLSDPNLSSSSKQTNWSSLYNSTTNYDFRNHRHLNHKHNHNHNHINHNREHKQKHEHEHEHEHDCSSGSSPTSDNESDSAMSMMASKHTLAPPSTRFIKDVEDVVIDNEDKFSRPKHKKSNSVIRPETWL